MVDQTKKFSLDAESTNDVRDKSLSIGDKVFTVNAPQNLSGYQGVIIKESELGDYDWDVRINDGCDIPARFYESELRAL